VEGRSARTADAGWGKCQGIRAGIKGRGCTKGDHMVKVKTGIEWDITRKKQLSKLVDQGSVFLLLLFCVGTSHPLT
jgi:hypothetical protein